MNCSEKPTFIGIGVQKCATSWLHDLLHAHPQIFTTDPKEIDFFSYFFDRGYEWYERFFAEGVSCSARGETSPSYFYHPSAPARAHAYNPDMRIIVIFRDPVARAFSNHLHELRARHFTQSLNFEDGLRNNPCYVEQGRYATYLENWRAVFPDNQILPLIFEEIIQDQAASVRRVYEFLQIDATAKIDASRSSANESVAYRRAGLQKILQTGGHKLRRAGFGPALERFKSLPPVAASLNLNKRDLRQEIPKPSPQARHRIAMELADEMRGLARILGRQSLPWDSFPTSELGCDRQEIEH